MRKLLNYLLLVTASIVLMSGSCSGGDEPEPSPGPTPVNPDPGKEDGKLSVSPTTLTFNEQTEYYQMVTISSPTAGWTAQSDQEWCTPSRKSATELEIGVSYNYTTAERKAIVTVTAGEQTAIINVTQAGSAATLTIDRTTLSYAADGDQDSIVHIHCTPSYEGLSRRVEGGDGWLTIWPTDDIEDAPHDYISVSAATNETLEPRSAKIIISLPEAEPQVITVTQEAGFFQVYSTDEVEYPYHLYSNNNYIYFLCTMKQTDRMACRVSDESWVHVTQWYDTSGTYGIYREDLNRTMYVTRGIFYYELDDNDSWAWRTCDIDFMLDGVVMKTVRIKQAPTPRLSVVASHGTALPSSGGTLDLKVYTNYDNWTVGEPSVYGGDWTGEPWFTAQRINDNTVRLTCQPRKGNTPRPQCRFEVKAGGLTAYPVIVEKDGTAGVGYTYGEGTRWDGE